MRHPVAKAFIPTSVFVNSTNDEKASAVHRSLSEFVAAECTSRGVAGATRIELKDMGSEARVERAGDDVISEEELAAIAKELFANPEMTTVGWPVLLFIHSFKECE